MECEMGTDPDDMDMDMDVEVLSSMWPEDLGSKVGKQFNMEKPGGDLLEEVNLIEEPSIVDFKRLLELTNYSEKGSSQLSYLVKHWEYKQANAVRLLNEELDILNKQRQEVELKKLEILEDIHYGEDKYSGDKRSISIMDRVYDIWEDLPRRKNNIIVQNKSLEIDAEFDTCKYWKQRALQLEKLLEASVQREQTLMQKLQESIKNLQRESSPVEELSQILKRADNFLHFILQTAPVVIGHQDKDMRYRFIYNHFPSLEEQDIIGKTDLEIFSGVGVKEAQDFKREVLERGVPAKREFTFDTELFGEKTFLMYVEPVFSKAGETIGVNYMGMDLTDQVIKREKMAKIREEIAVQKAKETELNKTIHITEETMRAKQMLATMSHEIRSPLSGVVSMAEILTTTKLDHEQRQLLDVMISSGDLVLQLINDILDLSKVESGAMKLEATKFRPREVVKHVLQTAAASLQKMLTLEGNVADDVPVEVIGDVLRIRQILTNLVSNAIKFTHEGKVGINLYVIPNPCLGNGEGNQQKLKADQSAVSANRPKEEEPSFPYPSSPSKSICNEKSSHCQEHGEGLDQTGTFNDGPNTMFMKSVPTDWDVQNQPHLQETTVWIRCDVHDTGIGIPEKALPTLFKKYMQVSADHARKYGGTGLGLAICKQLVELMGGQLSVTSQEHHGSTFTFVLPYKVSLKQEHPGDVDEVSDMDDHEVVSDGNNDEMNSGFFVFQPRTLGSLFSSTGSKRAQKCSLINFLSEDSYSFPSDNGTSRETASLEDARSMADAAETFCSPESSSRQDLEPDYRKANCKGKKNQADAKGQFQSSGMVSPCFAKTCKEVSETEAASKLKDTSRRQDHEKSDRSFQSINSYSEEPPGSTRKPKILLVEDNKINVMVTRSMMKQLGHSLDVVNNGVEAVHAVQCHRYDLILMDVCMPVMDGLQTTRLIRSFEETGNWDAAAQAGIEKPVPSSDSLLHGPGAVTFPRRIPIIAMTANALAESSEECLANGMDSFVSKPVTFQKLKECLQQYLHS
ncbi:probable histidine kinase 1 [Macadamia integrifolia]|uniref:probable histidine kinase 1 n=1 Tax=Macadamia integrifolia TaxID=60698 RepID=UPI001C4FE331|nr:probable histidine kinase 1 [Macadamia integrifolia]XP_042477647.1 probable histidine kinase 1 [Macadamia integrifolia]